MQKVFPIIAVFLLLASCNSGNDTTAPPTGPEPVVLWISSNADITGETVLLRWATSMAGDFSRYAVVMESANDSVLTTICSINVTQYRVEGLKPGTTYRLRVDVKTTDNATGRSRTIEVTTREGLGFDPSTTPDLLMQNLKNSWEQRSIVEYEKLLDDQFQFFFDPNDGLEQFVGPSWGHTEEWASAKAMFQGTSGYDLIRQEDIPPVLSIEFLTFAKVIDWSDPGTDPLYEGTVKARYKVGIKVQFQGVEQYTLVTGDNDFYVTKVQQTDGPDIYKIKVWEDRGYFLKGINLKGFSESTTWGRLKAQF
jgi:hypothetical protein